jgi:hypothetical protein
VGEAEGEAVSDYIKQPDVPGHPEPHTMTWSEMELGALHLYGRECYEAGKQEQLRIEQSASHRNWMLLAFRALNDTDGVLQTIVPESSSEERKLAELRDRVQSLAIQVPTLLGMTYAGADSAAAQRVNLRRGR